MDVLVVEGVDHEEVSRGDAHGDAVEVEGESVGIVQVGPQGFVIDVIVFVVAGPFLPAGLGAEEGDAAVDDGGLDAGIEGGEDEGVVSAEGVSDGADFGGIELIEIDEEVQCALEVPEGFSGGGPAGVALVKVAGVVGF